MTQGTHENMALRRNREGLRADVEVMGDVLVRRGVVLTDAFISHYDWDLGPIRLSLDLPDTILGRWREAGITSLPLVKNHGLNSTSEGSRWSDPPADPANDVWGEITNLDIESVDGRRELVGDWRFSRALLPERVWRAMQGGFLSATSGGFELERTHLRLVNENMDGRPAYVADWWLVREGSVTVVGADPAGTLRGWLVGDRLSQGIALRGRRGRRGAALGGLIEEKREELSLTNEQLGAAMTLDGDDGISAATVTEIVAGEINCPPQGRLAGLAEILEIAVADLVDAGRADGCYAEETSDARARCACSPSSRERDSDMPEMTTEQIESLVQRTVQGTIQALTRAEDAPDSGARAAADGTVDSPEEAPAVPEPSIWDVLIERTKEFGVDRSREMVTAAQGNPEALGALIRIEEHARNTAVVPAGQIEGGDDAGLRVLQDMEDVLIARGLKQSKLEIAAQARARVEKRNANALKVPTAVWLKRWCRATGVVSEHEIDSLPPIELTRVALAESYARSQGRQTVRRHGAHYIRAAGGGLVPDDLPGALRNISFKVLLAAHDDLLLPAERLVAMTESNDFKETPLIRLDMRGTFDPLDVEEQLAPLLMKEAERTTKPRLYGHTHHISLQFLWDDDIGVLTEVPRLAGRFYAAGKNRVIVNAMTGIDYTGRQVNKAIDYYRDVLQVGAFAVHQRPVPLQAGEDAGTVSASEGALRPTVAVMGEGAWIEWRQRTEQLQLASNRDEAAQEALQGLRDNSYSHPDVPYNRFYLMPGPETGHAPLHVSTITGFAMRMELVPTGGDFQSGLQLRCETAWHATAPWGEYAYELIDTSVPSSPALPS